MRGELQSSPLDTHRVFWDVEVHFTGAVDVAEELAEVLVDAPDEFLERPYPLRLDVLRLRLVAQQSFLSLTQVCLVPADLLLPTIVVFNHL